MSVYTTKQMTIEAVRVDEISSDKSVDFSSNPDWLDELINGSVIPPTISYYKDENEDGEMNVVLETDDSDYFLREGDWIVKLGDNYAALPGYVFASLFEGRRTPMDDLLNDLLNGSETPEFARRPAILCILA